MTVIIARPIGLSTETLSIYPILKRKWKMTSLGVSDDGLAKHEKRAAEKQELSS
jgi:hypothetical protein